MEKLLWVGLEVSYDYDYDYDDDDSYYDYYDDYSISFIGVMN